MELRVTPLFEATLDSPAPVVKVLNSVLISQKSPAACLFRLGQCGVTIVTKETQKKTLQGTVELPKQIFSLYNLHTNRDSTDVKISLKSFIDCIRSFTDCPEDDGVEMLLEEPFTLGLKLMDEETPLILTIKSGVTETQFELTPLIAQDNFQLFPQIGPSDVISVLAIEVTSLTESWLMFDQSCKKFSVKITRDDFTFSMEGINGTTSLSIKRDHTGVKRFEYSLDSPVLSSYRTELLRNSLRPIFIAREYSIVHLKTSIEGLLSIKCAINIGEIDQAHVEYVLRPIGGDLSGDDDTAASFECLSD